MYYVDDELLRAMLMFRHERGEVRQKVERVHSM